MSKEEIAKAIYEAFVEGYNSYSTPCNAFNSVEEAWEESSSYQYWKSILGRK